MGRTIRMSLLASAAAVALTAGATSAAAEEPVEYVRVCDVYGAGFFYIPGTETCLKVSGFVRGELLDGPDYRIRGFAFEPQPGVLRNPLFDTRVSTDGHRIGGGVDFAREPIFIPGTDIQIRRPFSFRGFSVGVDYSEVEGRATAVQPPALQVLPNLGIPGVGQDFGVFIPFPTHIVDNRIGVGSERLAVRAETEFGLLRGFVDLDPGRLERAGWSTDVNVLFGAFYSRTDTHIGHTLGTHTPLFGPEGDTTATYRTLIEERSITPYVGLSAKTTMPLAHSSLHFGVIGRVGPSFVDVDVHDSLRATGLGGRINLAQDIHRSSSETLTYGAVTGIVGITAGPLSVSFTGMAEHGLFNQPNIFRQDSVEVSPGVFQPVPTQHSLKEDWTYSAGLRIAYSFRPPPPPQ